MKSFLLKMLIIMFFLTNCSEKTEKLVDPVSAFKTAKEPFEDEHYEIAVQRLGEFKSRFPYSLNATRAELMIADCHFQLNQFIEAAHAYQDFLTLHPNHPKLSFVQFRIGEAYWKKAPEEIDREQSLTHKAVAAWLKLGKEFPNSSYYKKVKPLILEGESRIFKSQQLIASYYCKQGFWYSCAYRHLEVLENMPIKLKELKIKSLNEAAKALEELAQKDDVVENLLSKKWTKKQMITKAQLLRKEAQNLP